jgi:photosystem II stability/assembly factor-like uncharacterized protein
MQIRYTLIVLFLAFFTIHANGQKIDLDQLENLKIRNIGPAGMSGRVTAIDVDLSDTDRIYVGTASGGAWLSESGGNTWKPIFDDQPTLSIGAIKINQNNPDEIWVGTGEGNPRNSHNSGAGVFKSIDGGKTWKCMGLKESRLIHRIIIHRDNPNIIFVGAMGSAWGPTSERGVFKTTDGGTTWKKVLYVNDQTGIADMVSDPANPNKLIAAMWEFGRTPWTFNSGGDGSGLYISYDAGENWKKITKDEGLPKGPLGRIGVAIAPSDPEIVYALVEATENGLYKSSDGGENWSLVSKKDIGNRPFYYAEIYVDPKNENRIYNLWSYVSRSEDGGKTFKTIMNYGNNVHPDHHAFWIHPEDPDYMINGNDGGLNISRDRGKSWQFINNLPVGQFYHVSVDNDFPYHVYGGMQDNGSWIGPAYVLKAGGIRNYDWQELYFGDGFDVLARPDNNRYGYAMSQGGNLIQYDRETGRTQYIKPVHPEGKNLRFHWNAALAQDPYSNCGIYYGSQYVHKSMDCGKSWEIISPDLTTNDTSKQQQHISGGLTIDDTEAENHTTILCISPSEHNENVIWVGTDDGNLQLTMDGGSNWTNLVDRIPGFPKNAWIPQIKLSAINPGEAFVVVNNYRMNDWTPFLYYTSDFGRTWERLVDENDVESFVCSVVQDPVEPSLLFLGTDSGLYISFDKGSNWSKWHKNFPSVQVRDLAIQSREHDLVIGTFGRAFWVLDDIRPLRKIAQSKGAVLEKDFVLFEPPVAYQNTFRSYDGIRFIAQGEFVGANRGAGAMLTFWVKEEQKKEVKKEESEENDEASEEDKKKTDKSKVYLAILSETGDTVRQYSQKIKNGINRIYWSMTQDGVRSPSRSTPKEKDDLPAGSVILPGKYKILCKKGEYIDSTWIQVNADPRISLSPSDYEQKNAALQEFNTLVVKASKAFDQLKDAKKTIGLVNTMIENQPDSTKKEIKSLGKENLATINDLMKLYMNPEGTKGIQRNSDQLNSRISWTQAYLSTAWGAPGDNTKAIVKNTTIAANEIFEKINKFIQEDWKNYQEKVNALEINLFKSHEAIPLKD